MKRVAEFIVNNRVVVFVVMMIISIICATLIGKVNQNSDMTKYLADDSNMKQGIDIMAEEFDEQQTSQQICVMFKDLDESEKLEIKDELAQIKNVESVTYDKKSKQYNKKDKTLYKVNTECEYGSEEVDKIHSDIEEKYKNYDVLIIDNGSKATLGMDIMVAACTIMMIIMFVMSRSWIEPLLCVFVIGVAILINMGTNIFRESVSETTFSIAAILQLALSMDYSIILMNRYRQEKAIVKDSKQAMKNALTNAFSSITSSAFTTFVGLLMLVFMNYKLGMDMGIVLAKGVLCSWLSILTVFPFLIILLDNVLKKTEKKSPHVPMDKVAAFSYKFKKVMPVLFIVVFIVAFILQKNTGYAFTTIGEDTISKVFPRDNMIVTLYDNKDEDEIQEIVDELEDEEKVESIVSYPTTIGKQVTSKDMTDMVGDYATDMDIELDESLLNLLYYDYHKEGKLPTIAISDLINFIADDVVNDKTLAKELDKDMIKQVDDMKKFAKKETLTKKMSIDELADFFDMNKKDLKSLFVLYYSKKGGVDTGSMTLKTFVDFISNDVMNNKDYSDMFDKKTKEQIKTLKTYVDKEKMTKKMSYTEAAKLLGMSKDKVKLLYVYYYAKDKNYTPDKMNIREFIDFMLNKVAKNKDFSSQFDKDTLNQIKSLETFTDKKVIKTKYSSKKMASLLGMDKSMIDLVYTFYYGTNEGGASEKITLPQFINFILNDVMDNKRLSSNFDENMAASLNQMNSLLNVAMSGAKLTAGQLAATLGMEEEQVTMLMSMSGAESMTLPEFTNFMVNVVLANPTYATMIDVQTQESLKTMNNLMQAATVGVQFSAQEMGAMLGIDTEQVKLLYTYYKGTQIEDKKMTPVELVEYLLAAKKSGGVIGNAITDDVVTQLKTVQNFMNISLKDTKFSHSKMASMFGLDASTMKLLYTLHDSYEDTSKWKLSMQTIVNFLVDNSKTFGDMIDNSTKSTLELAQKLINGTVKGTKYSVSEMANLLDMDKKQLKQLYLLYISEHGNTSSWGTSIQKLVNFLIEDVFKEKDFADMFDKDTKETITSAKVIIDAVVSGKKYSAKDATNMLKKLTDELDKNTVELLYLFYGSKNYSEDNWKMSIETLFYHLADEVVEDEKFSSFIDGDMKKEIKDLRGTLEDGINQLVGDNYSIMMINTTYPDESVETHNFVDKVNKTYSKTVDGNYYMIGNSVMNYEMKNSFNQEVLLMTLLTAISIFIIVALTFKSISIPLILVLIVQCSVYITVAYSGLTQGPMQYIAYLLVQCILMGATIDYAILFTNYYKQSRRIDMSIKESLKEAYQGSIHTIFTSGAVLLSVTGIIGAFTKDVVGDSCRQVAIGTFVAIVMILFVLPGTIAVFDKMVLRRERKRQLKMKMQ